MRLRNIRENIRTARVLRQKRPWLGSSATGVDAKNNGKRAQQRSGRQCDGSRSYVAGGCCIGVPSFPCRVGNPTRRTLLAFTRRIPGLKSETRGTQRVSKAELVWDSPVSMGIAPDVPPRHEQYSPPLPAQRYALRCGHIHSASIRAGC
jgi:hypothetical protein